MAAGRIVNKLQLARLLGTTQYEIDNWLARGCPFITEGSTKGKQWQFDTAAVIGWLKAGGAADRIVAADLERERARLAKEQADGQVLKNAQLRQALLPAAEVVQAW